MSHTFSHNTSSFNVINYITLLPHERLEILAWLSPLDPQRRHSEVRRQRVKNVGDWFLQTPEFRNWCSSGGGLSDGAALFCCGDLGVGKTYISSLVIDRLSHQTRGQNTAIVSCYHDFTARGEQSPANVLGSLLRQLVAGSDNIPAELVDAFEDRKAALGGQQLELDEIVKQFKAVASSRHALICIDALDECAMSDRFKLLGSLRDILQGSPGTRLFLTGRPHIRSEIEKRLRGTVATSSLATNNDDVTRYLRTRLKNDPAPEAMDKSLETEIMDRVTETMAEVFRLVSLNIEGILREPTIHLRRKRLNGMLDSPDLGIVYGPTLERIEAEGEERSRLAMLALMWVCYSERPLHVDELCHALAIEVGSTNFEPSNVPSKGTLLGCCQGLITVDMESSTARLVHSTLREYLCAHSDYFVNAHSTMAETCLTYLNSQWVKDLSANPSALWGTPFINYASRYWGAHARVELSIDAKSLALQLFDHYDDHISAMLLVQQVRSSNRVETDPSFAFTGLHCACFFGIAEVVDALIGMKSCGINQRDRVGVTPLIWAAMYGHQDVVKLLLGQEGVDPNILDGSGRTALSWAKENGHKDVVKLLLESQGVSPDGSGGKNLKKWRESMRLRLGRLVAREK